MPSHDVLPVCYDDCGLTPAGCMACANEQPNGRCCCGRYQIDDTSLDDGGSDE